MINPVYPFMLQEIDSAIYGKKPEIVKLLVQYGADPNKKNREGLTLAEQVKQRIKKSKAEDNTALNEILNILESSKDIPKIDRYARYISQDSSMVPTIANQERTWVDKQYYHSHSVSRNDLILFVGPDGHPSMKRVIGLPGDTLRVDRENVYINGNRLSTTVLPGNKLDQAEIALGDGQVFVIGDNFNESTDSRSAMVGPISLEQITGKIIHVEHRYIPSEVLHPVQRTK